MRRFLRLLTLWLIALALPIQGAAAASAMAAHASAPSHATMTMPGGATMDAAAMPCHGHAIDKTGCGACCGPIVTQQALLTVAPVDLRRAAIAHGPADAAPPLFLTGGTDRPPRPFLA